MLLESEPLRAGIYGTRSSNNWNATPAKMDVLNLRRIFPGGKWGIPTLEPCGHIPTTLAAWHHPAAREAAAQTGGALHFFLDDYRFERVWWKPEACLSRLREVGAALTPDFSLWRDMPAVTQMWQIYRSRWCGAYWQSQGIQVIPTVGWAGPESYEFAFQGLPHHSVVAVSALGVNDDLARELFQAGIEAMIDECEPSLLLSYGKLPAAVDVPVREYPTFWDIRRPPR